MYPRQNCLREALGGDPAMKVHQAYFFNFFFFLNKGHTFIRCSSRVTRGSTGAPSALVVTESYKCRTGPTCRPAWDYTMGVRRATHNRLHTSSCHHCTWLTMCTAVPGWLAAHCMIMSR